MIRSAGRASTFADLDGDGHKDLIVAYQKKNHRLSLSIIKNSSRWPHFDDRRYRRFLAVRRDRFAQHDGHEDIFATVFMSGIEPVPRIIVLRYEKDHSGRLRTWKDLRA